MNNNNDPRSKHEFNKNEEEEEEILNIFFKVANISSRDTLFDNEKHLLPFIESLIRTRRTGILNNPNHVCITCKTCSMRPEKVVLYRVKLPPHMQIAAQIADSDRELEPEHEPESESRGKELVVMHSQMRTNGEVNAAPRVLDDEWREEFVKNLVDLAVKHQLHVCIPDLCEHLVRGHDCKSAKMGMPCPHAVNHADADVRVINDVFSCTVTGTVHLCGGRCSQKMTRLDTTNGIHTCPLTGVLLGSHLETQMFGGIIQPYLAIGNGNDTDAIRKGKTHSKDVSISMQHDQQRATFTRMVEDAYDNIMTSYQRQEAEYEKVKHTHDMITSGIVTIVKKKILGERTGPIYPIHDIFSTIYRSWPMTTRNTYFSWFGAKRSLLKSISDATRESENEHMISLGISLSASASSRIKRNNNRIRELLLTSTKESTFLAREKKRHDEFKRKISSSIVKVYENLEKYARRLATTSTEKRAAFPDFKHVFVQLMYMTKTGHSLPLSRMGSASMENSCMVDVIPKFRVMSMLPPENMLARLSPEIDIRPTKKSAKDIFAMYQEIMNEGLVHEVEIKT